MTATRLRGLTRTLGLNPRRRTAPDDGSEPPGDSEAPSVPQNLSAMAISASQINLTWDPSTDNVGVTGYNIHRDNVLVDTSPTNAYADTGLSPGTEYEYEVSAFDAAANESARSAPDSATTHQAIITDGLVAEWRFDDGSGQQVTDHSGNGHHAQLGSTAGSDSNDPSWSGGALVFTAASSHYAPVLAGAPVSGSGTWTIHLAIKGIANSNVAVFSEGSSSSGTQFLSFFKSTSKFRVQYRSDNGTIIADVTSAVTVYDDAWHFVSVRRAGTTLTIVVDGTSQDFTIGAGTTLTLNRQAFGCLLRTAATNFASGSLAYAICYDTALSDAQIASVRTVVTALLADRGITLP